MAVGLLVTLPAATAAAQRDQPITVVSATDGTRREDAGNPSGVGLYRMDGLGGACVRLCRTPTSFTGSPSMSADGAKIAFDGWRSDLGEGIPDCRLYSFDADQPTIIRDLGLGMMPSWGPGAAVLAYSDNRGGKVGTMDANGEGRNLLAPRGWSAEWSPDGLKIAYTSRVNGPDVVVHDVLTGERGSLFKGSGLRSIVSGITWSPDSQQLCVLAHDANGATVIAVDSLGGRGSSRVISRRAPDAIMRGIDKPIAWGGDGKRIVFPASVAEVGWSLLFSLDTSGERPPERVPGLPEETHCTQPYWHPDGTLLFVGAPLNGAGEE